MYKSEELIKRLHKHSNDYKDGVSQDFAEVCSDCKIAADMISTLKSSKHTQKRRRQRLSKKNKEQSKKIEALTAKLNLNRDKMEFAYFKLVNAYGAPVNTDFDLFKLEVDGVIKLLGELLDKESRND